MKNTLTRTDFNFPGQTKVYHGKVRDVYSINDDVLVMIATDRISAFDVILPEGIPYKGQVLNIFRCNIRHCSQLEISITRPNGNSRTEMRTIQSRNGYSWLSDRKCVA